MRRFSLIALLAVGLAGCAQLAAPELPPPRRPRPLLLPPRPPRLKPSRK